MSENLNHNSAIKPVAPFDRNSDSDRFQAGQNSRFALLMYRLSCNPFVAWISSISQRLA